MNTNNDVSDKKIKLFCFSHGGGASKAYNQWGKYLDTRIDLCPIEYRGRGGRYKEKLYTDFSQIIEDMYEKVSDNINQKSGSFAFFGHSMGSLVAFEVCRTLQERKGIEPLHLFLSGRQAPNIIKYLPKYHLHSDEEFANKMLSIGGIPEKLIMRKNILKLYLNVLKKDLIALDTYKFENLNKLNCNISTLNGKDDIVTEDDASAWNTFTLGSYQQYMFEGGHFYLYEQNQKIIDVINTVLLT